MNDKIFMSSLAPYFNEFIDMKRSMGYKYDYTKYMIKSLDLICCKNMGNKISLSKEIVDEWIKKNPNESNKTCLYRIRLLNEISKYLILRGIEAYIITPEQIHIYRPKPYIPHIFNSKELEAFFNAADSHPPHRAHPISDKMYSVLFRLLYCCGLRISEALRLTYRDIDMDKKALWISNSKFCKDRIVPLSESMFNLLCDYLPIVHTYYPDNIHIFPSRFNKDAIQSRSAYDYFRRILWKSGIPHEGRGKGPRMHDFRHSFAVHSLHKLVVGGMDVYAALPLLATYLGHEDISITEQYLRLTSDIFPEILKQVDHYCNGVIPEVINLENN